MFLVRVSLNMNETSPASRLNLCFEMGPELLPAVSISRRLCDGILSDTMDYMHGTRWSSYAE